MILKPDQLAALTGRHRAAGQIQWLTEHGYRFDVNALGRPVVLEKEVENKLLSNRNNKNISKSIKPNFAAINAD
jgi:hypothetical protein